jgi:hypothetical protein
MPSVLEIITEKPTSREDLLKDSRLAGFSRRQIEAITTDLLSDNRIEFRFDGRLYRVACRHKNKPSD